MRLSAVSGVAPEWKRLPAGCGFVDEARQDVADPYLVWADLTRFADFVAPGAGLPAQVKVLVELAGNTLPDDLARVSGVSVAPAYLNRSQGLRYCSASFDAAACRRFADPGNGMVARFELAMPLATRRPRPRPPPPLRPADRLATAPPAACEVLLAIIDHGCAFAHAGFREGTRSRVLRLWDQDAQPAFGSVELPGAVPAAFGYGREVCRDELGRMLQACSDIGGAVDQDRAYDGARYPELRRHATHGAFVMDQFIGRRRLGDRMALTADTMPSWAGSGALHSDTADLVFVQLPRDAWADPSALALSACVLDALRHIQSCKGPAVRRVVVNLSCAVHRGPHDGSALLDGAIKELLDEELDCHWNIVVPAGNAYEDSWHACGRLEPGQSARLTLRVPPGCEAPSFVELWVPGAPEALAWSVQAPGAMQATAIPASGCCLQAAQGIHALALRSHSPSRGRGGSLFFLALAAAPLSDEPGAAGIWQIHLQLPAGGAALDVQARVGRNESTLGAPLRHRPARLVDERRMARRDLSPRQAEVEAEAGTSGIGVERRGTASALAAAPGLYVAAAARLRPVPAAASFSGHGLDTQRAAAALGDESRALPGIRGAGSRSASVVRLQGTSFAAPQMARSMADQPLPPVVDPRSSGAKQPDSADPPRLTDVFQLAQGPSDRLGAVLIVPRLGDAADQPAA